MKTDEMIFSPPADGLHTARWAAHIAADISEAADTISISALSFLPPRTTQHGDLKTLCAELIKAVSRGVSVQVIIPAPTSAHAATKRNESAAQWCKSNGIKAYLLPGEHLLHAKTVLIDKNICWVGSGNLTTAAATHNHEAWIRQTGYRIAAQLSEFHGKLKGKAYETDGN